MTSQYTAAILLKDVPIQEGTIWWTNVDRLQQRLYDTTMVEPYIPESKRCSYSINTSTVGGEEKLGKEHRAYRRMENKKENVRSTAVPNLPCTDDPLSDSDSEVIVRRNLESNRKRLRTKGTKGKANFDLRQEWRNSLRDYSLHGSIHGIRQASQPQAFVLRR